MPAAAARPECSAWIVISIFFYIAERDEGNIGPTVRCATRSARRGRPTRRKGPRTQRVNRDPGRAQGTAATTTPCTEHDTRRVLACRYTRVVPDPAPRQRRRVGPGHSPGSDGHTASTAAPPRPSDAPTRRAPTHRGRPTPTPPTRSPCARPRAHAAIPSSCALRTPY